MILFTLSMPNTNTWNGHWSGEKSIYAKTRYIKDAETLDRIFKGRKENSFYYNFGDGWGASVKAEQMDSALATKIMRKSAGFCGYDWMINEIVTLGYIRGAQNEDV